MDSCRSTCKDSRISMYKNVSTDSMGVRGITLLGVSTEITGVHGVTCTDISTVNTVLRRSTFTYNKCRMHGNKWVHIEQDRKHMGTDTLR